MRWPGRIGAGHPPGRGAASWRLIGATAAFLGVCGAIPAPARAQDLGITISPVVVMDTKRVFEQTRLGQLIVANLEDQVRALAEENRRITADLEAEERDLTEKRPTLPPEEFRKLADAFDRKAQRIRAEQDAKLRALQKLREQEQQSFIDKIAPVVVSIARRHGAVVVLERGSAVWSSDSIDITAESIREINSALQGNSPENTPDDAPKPGSPPAAPPQQAPSPPATEK